MNRDKSIVELNNRIDINSDRVQIIETAIIFASESDIKDLFYKFQETSKIYKSELAKEVQKMSGVAIVINNNSFFVRLWLNLKASFINSDRKYFLNTIAYKEFEATKSYLETVNDHFRNLNTALIMLVKTQQNLLSVFHYKAKQLGDLMLN